VAGSEMSWLDHKTVEVLLCLAAGWFGCYGIIRWKRSQHKIALAQKEAEILESSRRQAEAILREAKLAGNEEAAKIREQVEKSFDARRQELSLSEQRLAQKETVIVSQLEGVIQKEKSLRTEQELLAEARSLLEKEKLQLEQLSVSRREQLEKTAGLSACEARALLLKEAETNALKDAADLSRHIMEGAKARADDQARRLISLAIQRHAGTHTFETTTATVALQGDDIKGRIIGREGRNIRAFEAATGITVLIDDTPNAVVLSGFDPVRREIARESMQRLILDGRIHPTRIEEVVNKVSEEMEETIQKAGEDAVYKLGLAPLHLEIIKRLGALRFRHSFSQNILDHSIEVAQLMGIMAAELGLDMDAAKKSGLLHDIGKAMNHEVEGSHAIVGADLIKRYGESEEVVNAVASHHDEVPHTNPLGILVSAADAISASRPGARSESMTTYIKRLENLEQIGLSFSGVEKCFAVHAGRELRVVVQPEEINDEQALTLARDIVHRIEDELQYPGQIRVTVVREKRCVEYAK
jgi:ribonuclease Y